MVTATSVAPDVEARPRAAAPQWYAVWTRSRHERTVHDQIRERGVEVFLPMVTRWSRWRDRKKQIEWPLFPGYCFARFNPAARLEILSCQGVVSVVSFDGELAPVPDREIDAIRTLLASALPYDPCPTIKTGTRVEVTHGPLKGVIGSLTRKGTQARLILAVDLIGRGVSVVVDAGDVRAI